METTEQKRIVTKQVPPGMRDNYIMRIKKAVLKDSRSGKPMIECDVEIAKPVYYETEDVRYDLSSLELMLWLPLGTDPWKGPDVNGSTNSLQAANRILGILGFEPIKEGEKPSDELLAELNNNFCFAMILTPTERVEMKQDPKGPKGKMVPITDRTGKPITRGWELRLQAQDILYREEKVEKNVF